jgi:TolA-binding protein
MKYLLTFAILSAGYIGTLWKYGGVGESVMTKIRSSQNAERRAEELNQENQVLRAKISTLQYEISQLESKNQYYMAQVQGKKVEKQTRAIASIAQVKSGDLVNYDVYRWAPEKLLAIGEKELHFKNYQKSAQFYQELLKRHPDHEIVSDRVLFGAGVAAFEGNYYKWSEDHFKRLVENYPRSEFYRGAKLWMALSQYHQGENQKFLKTVEEFRLKYRNTEEWKILSRYYEDISYKIKK